MAGTSQTFDPEEFARTIARLKEGSDHGEQNHRPDFDPKLDAEVAADAIRGRKIEEFKVALEALGFRFVQPMQLAPYVDQWGRPMGRPTEGQWRSERLRMAFTDRDILRRFAAGGPEEFVTWIEQVVMARRLEKAGLFLGKDARGKKRLMNRRTRRPH